MVKGYFKAISNSFTPIFQRKYEKIRKFEFKITFKRANLVQGREEDIKLLRPSGLLPN